MDQEDIVKHRQLIILFHFLRSLSSSHEMPLNVKQCLQKMLFRQILRSGDPQLASCFSLKLEKEYMPKNFKSMLQKALIDKLDSLKSEIETVLQLSDGEFSHWSDVDRLIETNSSLKTKFDDQFSKMTSLTLDYHKKSNDYIQRAESFLHNELIKEASCFETYKLWLKAKSEALQLKTRLTEAQMLEKRFTTEKIKSLSVINKKEQEELESLKAQIKESKIRLNSYVEVSGKEFDSIISEYGKLEKNLNDKRWALKEFGATSARTTIDQSSNNIGYSIQSLP